MDGVIRCALDCNVRRTVLPFIFHRHLLIDPQAGHEQGGRRPALVLSPQSYNGKVGLMLCCPITSRRKGYPFEVSLPEDSTVKGVILCDQLKSLDWRACNEQFILRIPDDVTAEVLAKVNTLLQ